VTERILSVVERRATPRVGVGDLPTDLSGRVRPGQSVRVIDLSCRGALLESNRRLLPGSRVDVHFECCRFRHLTRATVIRCYVGLLLPNGVVFRAAIEFDRHLEQWRVVPEPLPVNWHRTQAVGQGWSIVHTGR
jgi:hypothetical protein